MSRRKPLTGKALAQLKAQLVKLSARLDRQERQIGIQRDRLEEQYIRKACPFRKGDLVRWRDDMGRIHYGVVDSISCSHPRHSRGIHWFVYGRETLKSGDLPARFRHQYRLFSEGKEVQLIERAS